MRNTSVSHVQVIPLSSELVYYASSVGRAVSLRPHPRTAARRSGRALTRGLPHMHTARLLRPLAVAASVAALAMFAALPAGATAASSPHSSKIVQVHPMILTPGASTSGSTVVSGNWAGYAALPRHPGGKFRYIAATFTVPSVNCSATPNSFSVHWVGLDGAGGTNPTVEQDGIESDCNGSTPEYTAWWETFPGNSIQPVASIDLSPGDAVIASVFYN